MLRHNKEVTRIESIVVNKKNIYNCTVQYIIALSYEPHTLHVYDLLYGAVHYISGSQTQ